MAFYDKFPYTNFHELNLDWILTKVRELQTDIDEINSWKETFSAQINAQISNLISEVNKEFTKLKADIEKEFTDYRTETDAAVNARLTAFDGRIADIESKLHDIETNLPTLVHVTNPFTGMSDTIQNVINALADTQRSDALTASAYDALAKTAAGYDAYKITAADYDFNGKSILV